MQQQARTGSTYGTPYYPNINSYQSHSTVPSPQSHLQRALAARQLADGRNQERVVAAIQRDMAQQAANQRRQPQPGLASHRSEPVAASQRQEEQMGPYQRSQQPPQPQQQAYPQNHNGFNAYKAPANPDYSYQDGSDDWLL